MNEKILELLQTIAKHRLANTIICLSIESFWRGNFVDNTKKYKLNSVEIISVAKVQKILKDNNKFREDWLYPYTKSSYVRIVGDELANFYDKNKRRQNILDEIDSLSKLGATFLIKTRHFVSHTKAIIKLNNKSGHYNIKWNKFSINTKKDIDKELKISDKDLDHLIKDIIIGLKKYLILQEYPIPRNTEEITNFERSCQ